MLTTVLNAEFALVFAEQIALTLYYYLVPFFAPVLVTLIFVVLIRSV